MAEKVMVLKDFRDTFLLTNSLGESFVRVYYKLSPPMADFIAKHDSLRLVVRWSLLPLVGLSWIALNVGPMAAVMIIALILALLTVTIQALCRRVQLQRCKA